MDTFRLGRLAYAAYAVAVGNNNFQGNPMPTFDELNDTQKAGWQAAAEAAAGFVARIGDEVVPADTGVPGVVRSQCMDIMGRGYWLECRDNDARPFDHFVREPNIGTVNGMRPGRK